LISGSLAGAYASIEAFYNLCFAKNPSGLKLRRDAFISVVKAFEFG
jgi:hypothetical protein